MQNFLSGGRRAVWGDTSTKNVMQQSVLCFIEGMGAWKAWGHGGHGGMEGLGAWRAWGHGGYRGMEGLGGMLPRKKSFLCNNVVVCV